MRIVINGVGRDVADGSTVAAVLERFTEAHAGVAVAVNGAVVRRSDWDTAVLREADQVEMLTAVQGG